jgi:glutathione S-transferase
MSLTLYYHPLSSYCWKVLTALYENDTPFTPLLVNLGEEASSTAFKKVWPIGKFPVVRDEAKGKMIPESSTIIEYLDRHYPGRTALIPADADAARETRLRDRFYDLHVHTHMQKIVGDRIRPADKKDPFGVEQARAQLAVALGMIEEDMAAKKKWTMGDDFTMADCSAAPALYYANLVAPFSATHKSTAAYLNRLLDRPSFARAVREAEPYKHFFPT